MQTIRFSGTFTFNARDRQDAQIAQLDSQSHITQEREAKAFAEDTNDKPLLITTMQTEDGDQFYIRTSPSRGNRAARKDLQEIDNLLKKTCKNRDIPFEYSPSHSKSTLQKLSHALIKAVHGSTANKISASPEPLPEQTQGNGSESY